MSDEWRMPKHERDRLEPFQREMLQHMVGIRAALWFIGIVISLRWIWGIAHGQS